MVKPEQQHKVAAALNSVDSDTSGEDNWVIVKKQRVNILIPALPNTEPPILLDDEQDQLLGDIHNKSQLLDENPPEVCLHEGYDGSLSLSPKTNILSNREVYPHLHDVVATMKPNKSSPWKLNGEHRLTAVRDLHNERRNMISKTSSGLRPFRSLERSALHRVSIMAGATTFCDKIVKASNLEQKIVRVGGLDKWLSSLGLDQFIKIFHGKKINKFQLANLSMKKLEDMGARAVRPRRKLIHAIECAILF